MEEFPFDESRASAVLASHGIPSVFPLRACFFSERVVSFAESNSCETLEKLAVTPLAREVADGGTHFSNFGEESANSLLDFQSAVAADDKSSLQRYLPLSLNRGGIDLGVATKWAASNCQLGLDGLIRRLINHETLEKVGASKRLTRERVRQIEEKFVDYLMLVLDGIPGERTKRWEEWEDTGSVGDLETDESGDVSALVGAALGYSFSREPEAKAIRIRQFKLAKEAAAYLASIPETYSMGLDGVVILSEKFPELRWHRFIEWSNAQTKKTRLLVCHGGKIRIENPVARDVVAALLCSGETRPRQIISFLLGLPDLWSWPDDSLINNCATWRQKSQSFPQTELADQEEDSSVIPRINAEIDAESLIDFVRQTGPRELTSLSGVRFEVEAHLNGLIIVGKSSKGRRLDRKAIEKCIEIYRRTKSLKTTAYSSGFHSTYFIALVAVYERERPYLFGEIDIDELDVILSANSTDQLSLLQSRVGQGQFRKDLITNRKSCYVTGLDDARFLRASHIKPWRDCDDVDRLDWRNGLLLTPNLDLLFDQGFISFDEEGGLLISSQMPREIQESFGLSPEFKGVAFDEKTRAFMAEHRAKIFLP